MAQIHFKRDFPSDPSLRIAVEKSLAALPEEYSVSLSVREGTDDWSVQVVGPASVAAGRIAVNDQKPEAITRYVGQMFRGLHRPQPQGNPDVSAAGGEAGRGGAGARGTR